MQFKFSALVFFAVAVGVNLAGCGTIGTTDPAQSTGAIAKGGDAASKVVVARAQLRWDALVKADLSAAYQFISPAGRTLMSLRDYQPRVNASYWRSAKVTEASCAAETCEVAVSVDLLIEGVKVNRSIKETWIWDAGQWWFVYQG